MTVRESLAKLSTQLTKPLREYIAIDVAVDLSKNTILLSKLEPFHLPEITKLICGHPSLRTHFGDAYDRLFPFYEDGSADSMMIHFADTSKDSLYYIDHIFPLADSCIIEGFIQAFNRLDKQIKHYQAAIKEQREEESRTLVKIEGNTTETATVIESLGEFPEGSSDEKYKELTKRRTSLKGNRTKYNKNLEATRQKIATLSEKYEQLCEQYRRLIEAYGVARKIKDEYQSKLSKARMEAYEACDEKAAILRSVQELLVTGNVPSDLVEGLRQYEYCTQFISTLAKDHPDRAISSIALLYEQGAIDICDDPFCMFLGANPEAVSRYFLNSYLAADARDFSVSATDFDSWCDFIISQAFFETDHPAAFELYDTLWDQIPTPACWRTIIERIRDRDEDVFISCLAKLILRASGNSRKQLITVTQEMIRQEEIDSVATLVAALIDNHTSGDDCSTIVELLLQKVEGEYRKIRGTNERLKFNADRISAKAYGSLSKPIESLEILASNIATSRTDISPEIISSKLKKYLVSLREGLEVLDIYALEDADAWVERKAIPFNPENHTISLSTPPQTVYLRTLGFTYHDATGDTKVVPAVVGRLQELGNSKPNNSHEYKPKHSHHGKPNTTHRVNTKHKYKKKDGAKE